MKKAAIVLALSILGTSSLAHAQTRGAIEELTAAMKQLIEMKKKEPRQFLLGTDLDNNSGIPCTSTTCTSEASQFCGKFSYKKFETTAIRTYQNVYFLRSVVCWED